MKGHLPTFIGIGAMKSGTTSLYHYLDQHPQVTMSTPKETNFFLKRRREDWEWYRQRFAGEAEAYGEISPKYAGYPGYVTNIEQMYEALPNLKLIYLLRDPIERAVSHYMHNYNGSSTSIDDAFQPVEKSRYINLSRYYAQISRYLEYYNIEDMLFIESERLRENRQDTMGEVFHFLGVNEKEKCANFDNEYNVTRQKK
jgi:hypothetical protein